MDKKYIPFVDELITLAIKEDIGDGDHTSLASVPRGERGRMKLLVKQEGILAGTEVARMIFDRLDKGITFELLIDDGTHVKPGDVAFYVEGSMITLLQAERIVLNVMQRMSGIATETAVYVKAVEGLKTTILDTRKTAPGLRVLDKIAVKTGGGDNHRMGLFDMILLKDNHVDFSGGVYQAVTKARDYLREKGKDLKIEVEVRTLEDIGEVFRAGGADIIMLDNFTPELTRKAVELIGGRARIESSGGITLKNIREYAECGVDYISVGALTHHVKGLDLSLKAV